MNHNLTIALIEPEIPGNTGAIARTCVATNTHLIVVGPTPFEITDSKVKRAGLDYWKWLKIDILKDFSEFEEKFSHRRWVLTTAREGQPYHEFQFKKDDIILFGKETKGLDKELVHSKKHNVITLPMWGETRSLNLANASTVFLYEAYRQIGFPS